MKIFETASPRIYVQGDVKYSKTFFKLNLFSQASLNLGDENLRKLILFTNNLSRNEP